MWIPAGGINLQATLQAGSASLEIVTPHHPITCSDELAYEEDGTFRCSHAEVPPGDGRTQQCLNGTAALLIFQILTEQMWGTEVG